MDGPPQPLFTLLRPRVMETLSLPLLFCCAFHTWDSSIHRGDFSLLVLPFFFFFLQNKSYKKTFNSRSIQDHTNEHSEAFLRWAAAVLILLFLGGPLRRCSQHSEDEISLHAQSLSLAAEGWTSSSGNDLKGSIHIKSLGWKWGAAKVSQNLWDLT